MATYDVHQHLWPVRFRAALAARDAPPLLSRGGARDQGGRFPIDLAAHEPEARIRALDRDGIDVAVLSLQASLGLETLSVGARDELEALWAEDVLQIAATSDGRFLASRLRACEAVSQG